MGRTFLRTQTDIPKIEPFPISLFMFHVRLVQNAEHYDSYCIVRIKSITLFENTTIVLSTSMVQYCWRPFPKVRRCSPYRSPVVSVPEKETGCRGRIRLFPFGCLIMYCSGLNPLTGKHRLANILALRCTSGLIDSSGTDWSQKRYVGRPERFVDAW